MAPAGTKLSKKQIKALKDYLEGAAHASLIHISGWTTTWSSLHGEGRSSSSITFRINIQKTSGKPPVYRAVIVCDSKAGNIIDGTLLEFQGEPDPAHILNQYKRMHGVEVSTPTDDGQN